MEKGGYGKKYRVVKHTYADSSNKWTVEWKYEGKFEKLAPWIALRPGNNPLLGAFDLFDKPVVYDSLMAAEGAVDHLIRVDKANCQVGRKIENI